MNALRQQLQRLNALFDARAPRERALMILAAMALVLALTDALVLSPALKHWQAARSQLRSAQAASQTLRHDLQEMGNRRRSDAQQLRAELASWRQRVRDGEEALHGHESDLVGPDRMVALLDELLASHGQLRVRSMRSLGQQDLLSAGPSGAVAAGGSTPAGMVPGSTAMGGAPTTPAVAAATPVAVPAPANAASGAATPGGAAGGPGTLYRHGVELTLEGSYGDLLAYLQALEAMPQHVLWGGLSLKVEQHPRTVMTLRLYTISRDRHWLEI